MPDTTMTTAEEATAVRRELSALTRELEAMPGDPADAEVLFRRAELAAQKQRLRRRAAELHETLEAERSAIAAAARARWSPHVAEAAARAIEAAAAYEAARAEVSRVILAAVGDGWTGAPYDAHVHLPSLAHVVAARAAT